jgi:RHS repeat-associated protein
LLATENAQVKVRWTWDGLGNQLSESLELLGSAFAGLGVKQLRRSFDVANRVEEVELPDGLGRLQRGYDAGDRLVSLGVDGATLWQASYDGARLGRIARGNGVVTAFAYTAEGLPAEVLTGLEESAGQVANPLHRLTFTWTLGQLQRSRLREDMARELWAFHYDSLGHLEDLAGDPAWPAVKRLEPSWQLPGLPVPASLVESWQVGQGDELLRRDRRQAGRHEPLSFSHNLLHQVTQGTGSLPVSYTWDVHGNLARRTGGFYGDASFTHDELDRLVRVEQGGAATELVLDPLGRLVGKVRQTGEGSVAKVYLHDGDQVVVEYGKGAGSSSWRAQRRHLWGRWIDDLAVEQVDMDGDGSLETSLWPVSDLLGSIELVTDGSGSIVERITYDPEGRPQVWSADTQRPRVTRVAWTGDGRDGRCPVGIPPVACPAWAFQLGFGEELDAASAGEATASLTPQGGQPVPLTVTLTPDTRAAYLTGATVQAGTSYTLHLEGLRDRAGNLLWQWGAHTGAPLLTFTLTDPTVFQVLEDTAPPRLLAALDAQDGLYLAWEEPVEVASGFNLDTSIAVLRQGQPVAGRVTRLSPQLFRWQPVEAGQWLPGGEYTLSAVHLQDLAAHAALAPSLSFTHMAASSQVAYLVYQAPGDSQPQARSAYGVTTLFQGRTWHEDLGLYHYRARWYLPEAGVFAERDPEGYKDSPNPFQAFNFSPVNVLDPSGTRIVVDLFANARYLAKLFQEIYQETGLRLGVGGDGAVEILGRRTPLPKGATGLPNPPSGGSGLALSRIAALLVENAVLDERFTLKLRLLYDNPEVNLGRYVAPAIELDFADFEKLDYGTPEEGGRVDPRAFDVSIVFYHELVHATLGLKDPPEGLEQIYAGPTVHVVNLIRKELGLNDQREKYGTFCDTPSDCYLRFNTGKVKLLFLNYER